MKNNQSGRAIVWILLAVVLLLGGASSWYYFIFMPGKKAAQNIPGIAKLVHFMNSVESRQAGKIDWRPAISLQELFDGDAVKTAVEANALIRYNETDTIRLDENSLVVIHALQRGEDGMEANLEILSGTVFGVATTTKLRLIAGNSVTVLRPSGSVEKPASMLVQVDADKSARISVVDGAAEIQHANGKEKISLQAGEGINFDSQAMAAAPAASKLPPAPQLLAPNDQATLPLIDAEPTTTVEFKIADIPENLNNSEWRYHLQVAKDRQFKTVVANRYFSGDKVTVPNLALGEYFWSVAAVDSKQLHGAFATTQSFQVFAAATAPAVVETPQFYEVDRLESAARLIREGKSTALQPGMKIGSGDTIEVTANGTVALRQENSAKVILQLRANTKLVVVATNAKMQLALQRGAVIVHQDQETATQIPQQIKVGEATFTFGSQQLGDAAQSDVLLEHLPPDRYRLVVLRGAHETKKVGERAGEAPPTGNKALALRHSEDTSLHYDGEMPIVMLQWPASQGPYTVEISRDRNFKEIIRSEVVADNNLPLLLDEPGSYFWRWRGATGKNGAATMLTLSDKPPVVAKSKTAAPTQISDRQKFTTVPYFGQPPQLTWSWQRAKNAVAFQLEISINANMQQPFFQSERVRQNSLTVLIDALKPGDYFWRVKQYDFRGKLLATTINHTLRVQPENPPLSLQISKPTNSEEVSEPLFVTTGKVTGKGVATINGEAIKVAPNGSFKHSLQLQNGENVLIYRLQGAAGTSITIQNKKIFYYP